MQVRLTNLPAQIQQKNNNFNNKSHVSFEAVPRYKVIDMENWAGKEVYDGFLNLSDPFCGVTSEVNIKNLEKLAKEKKTTVNTLIMYTIGKAANAIDAFKLRMVENKVVKFDEVCISPPVPAAGKEGFFNFCNIDFCSDLDSFIKSSRETIKAAINRNKIWPEEFRPDAVYLSHIKKHYTGLKNPTNGKYDFTPRINWGIHESKSKSNIPLTIEAHHSVISGSHIEKFLDIFQDTCDNELRPTNWKDKFFFGRNQTKSYSGGN